jgi:UDPglucose--hexose-1-phosphate uridylyltransferase
MSELRKDPTRGRWVLVRPAGEAPVVTDDCPFCPGNEFHTPPEIAAYRKDGSSADGPGWSVRVVPEIDPYFLVEQEAGREGVGLYDRVAPRGATELIVESPEHDATPAGMDERRWEQVLWMYRDRLRDLKKDTAIRDIMITRRYRKPGSRIIHPYSRVVAVPVIFDDVRRQLIQCREYFEYKRRCVFCDIVRQEIADEVRVIRLTPHFVALAPYASRTPYETWILPRRHACAYEQALTPDAVADLAALLRGHFPTLAMMPGDPPFEMALYTTPNQAVKLLPGEWSSIAEDYHWHLEITPYPDRLSQIGGIHVNDLPPEEAVELLRGVWAS